MLRHEGIDLAPIDVATSEQPKTVNRMISDQVTVFGDLKFRVTLHAKNFVALTSSHEGSLLYRQDWLDIRAHLHTLVTIWIRRRPGAIKQAFYGDAAVLLHLDQVEAIGPWIVPRGHRRTPSSGNCNRISFGGVGLEIDTGE